MNQASVSSGLGHTCTHAQSGSDSHFADDPGFTGNYGRPM